MRSFDFVSGPAKDGAAPVADELTTTSNRESSMTLGINTWLFVSPFTNQDTKLYPKFTYP
jgi:hypothetical protein